MGRRSKQILLQRAHTDGQKTRENMFNIDNYERYQASFLICWLSVCLLWRNVCLGLLPIFDQMGFCFCFCFFWAACIFWRLILCQLLHLQIFSTILRVVFSSSLRFPLITKSLSLIRSHLFVFILIILGGGSRKILQWFMSKSVFPVFKSLIHFEFTLVRWGSDFILVHVVVQFLKHHLLKTLSFVHCIVLPPLS